MKSALKLLLKIIVSVACLWYVSRKIDWQQTWLLLQQSQKAWLLLAAVFFVFSKIVSSVRLNIYFKNVPITITEKANLKLYWLGMFYNLFLPGGIGGDAYKVIILNRKGIAPSYKLTTAAVLLDRMSGMAGLGILAGIFYALLFNGTQYSLLVVAGILPALIVYWFIIKKFFPTFLSSFSRTLLLGFGVQILQIICIACLMQAAQVQGNFYTFQFIFLVSSIVAILPFTIGGLGAREIVFLWGATQFGLNTHEAVFISLLFYVITALTSLVGLYWVYKEPELVAADDTNKAVSG